MASRALQARRYRERIVNMLDYLGGACSECGIDNATAIEDFGTRLQIDHVDRTEKLFDPAASGRAWVNLTDELDKCQLLCKPCHGTKTREDQAA
jgi:5-methylcytosine-specific restriction endonuclease McrA